VSLPSESVLCLCLVVPALSFLLSYSSFFTQDYYFSYHIPLILLRGSSQTHLTPPLPSVQDLHTNTSTYKQWSILHMSMIAGILILNHIRATIDTLIDTAATSHPSHNTPICTARIRKATMSLIPPTSTSTTRYPSPRRVTSEQTQGPLHPCHLHHSSNKFP
jgi:hypothetical protein